MHTSTPIYVHIPYQGDMYEFAVRGLQILFINFYSGNTKPERVEWDDVPEAVKYKLLERYGE